MQEGLAWLGREPESRASLLVRLLALLARLVLFGAFRFKVDATGHEHLPTGGGYLLVAAIHRGWMDPFLIMHAQPLEPRVWFLGSGPSAFSARWREWLLHRVGGMLPVWRGGVGVEQHVALGAGGVAERRGLRPRPRRWRSTGPPDAPAAFRVGSALIALRTAAPIVPLAHGRQRGALSRQAHGDADPAGDERQRAAGRRVAVIDAGGGEPGELDLAHALTDRLAALFAPVIPELHAGTVDPPSRPRRIKGLTWLLLARPKPKRVR